MAVAVRPVAVRTARRNDIEAWSEAESGPMCDVTRLFLKRWRENRLNFAASEVRQMPRCRDGTRFSEVEIML